MNIIKTNPSSRKNHILKGDFNRPTRPWERWGVLGILGMSLLYLLVSRLTSGEGSILAGVLTPLMFIGIYTRSTWGWYLTNALCGLNALTLIGFGPMDPGLDEMSLYAGITISFGIILLLVISRLRGAYE